MGEEKIKLSVLHLKLENLFKGRGVDPVTWHLVFSDALKLAYFKGILSADKIFNSRFFLNSIAGKFIFYFYISYKKIMKKGK